MQIKIYLSMGFKNSFFSTSWSREIGENTGKILAESLQNPCKTKFYLHCSEKIVYYF